MASEQDYLDLTARRESLITRRAKLEEREETKKTRRAQILDELKELGIDPTNPEAEIKRLEEESQAAYDSAKREIDDFEKALEGVLNPSIPRPSLTEPIPETTQSKEVDTSEVDDIDI